MNVSLAPELERFLNEQVRSGRYSSPEEAVSKAVELLKETEEAESRLETLLQARVVNEKPRHPDEVRRVAESMRTLADDMAAKNQPEREMEQEHEHVKLVLVLLA